MSYQSRRALLASLLGLGLLTTLVAGPQAPGTPSASPSPIVRKQPSISRSQFNRSGAESRRGSKTIQVALTRADDAIVQTVSIEAENMPIREILKSIQEEHGVKIWIDRISLGKLSAALDQEVSLSAAEVPLSNVLDRLLLPAELDWLTDREVLRITSQTVAKQHLEARVYDVLDLVQAGFDEDALLEVLEGCVEPDSWSPVGGTGLFDRHVPGPDSPKNPAAPDTAPKTDQKSAVSAPQAMPPAIGPKKGEAKLREGVLFVWQTQRVHTQVEQLLDQVEVLLDDADEDRRFNQSVVTVKQKRPSSYRNQPRNSSRRRLLQ